SSGTLLPLLSKTSNWILCASVMGFATKSAGFEEGALADPASAPGKVPIKSPEMLRTPLASAGKLTKKSPLVVGLDCRERVPRLTGTSPVKPFTTPFEAPGAKL